MLKPIDVDEYEASFWGNCFNTYEEEFKQRTYARFMGLVPSGKGYALKGKKILDIGGGPISLLLKCDSAAGSMVADPCRFPAWTHERYKFGGIDFYAEVGEKLNNAYMREKRFDEVWIYNVLQHTEDPARIISNAKRLAPILRIFEWIDFPAYPGHPQALTQAKLEEWIGQPGTVAKLNENGCVGNSFSGTFYNL